MDGCFRVGRLVVQLLDAKNVGKGLQVLHARVFEGVGGLLAQRRTVHQEEHAAEALRLEQPVDQRNADLGLAGAGGHGDQQHALPARDRRFDRWIASCW